MDNLTKEIKELIEDAKNLLYDKSTNYKLNEIEIKVRSFIRNNFRDNICDYEEQFNKIEFNSYGIFPDYEKNFECSKNKLITLLGVIESNMNNSYYSNLSDDNKKLRLENSELKKKNSELKKSKRLKLTIIIAIIAITVGLYPFIYNIGYNNGEKKEFKSVEKSQSSKLPSDKNKK